MPETCQRISEKNNTPSPVQLTRLLLESLLEWSPPEHIPCNWTLARLKEQGILYIALWADRKGYISLSTDIIARHRKLENEALIGSMQSELAIRRLQKLLKNKVEFIVYKGYSLAKALYSPPQLRPATDIDILVRAQDAHRLEAILMANKYRRHADWVRGGMPFQASYLDPDENFIEAHFSLTQATRRPPQNELAWRESVVKNGIRIFKPEMNLLALALHAETHHFCLPIMNHIDAVLLAMRNPWEPTKLSSLAELNRCQRTLGVFLAQAYRFVPDSLKNDQIQRLFHIAGSPDIPLVRGLSTLIASTRQRLCLPLLRALIVFFYAPSFSAFVRSARDHFMSPR
jgi:hypothetical protein